MGETRNTGLRETPSTTGNCNSDQKFSRPLVCTRVQAKRKESGRLFPLSFWLGRCGGEFSGAIVPTRNGRGEVVSVKPVVDFLPRRLGEGGFHPVHDFLPDFGRQVLEVVLRKTVRHRINKPGLNS